MADIPHFPVLELNRASSSSWSAGPTYKAPSGKTVLVTGLYVIHPQGRSTWTSPGSKVGLYLVNGTKRFPLYEDGRNQVHVQMAGEQMTRWAKGDDRVSQVPLGSSGQSVITNYWDWGLMNLEHNHVLLQGNWALKLACDQQMATGDNQWLKIQVHAFEV